MNTSLFDLHEKRDRWVGVYMYLCMHEGGTCIQKYVNKILYCVFVYAQEIRCF